MKAVPHFTGGSVLALFLLFGASAPAESRQSLRSHPELFNDFSENTASHDPAYWWLSAKSRADIPKDYLPSSLLVGHDNFDELSHCMEKHEFVIISHVQSSKACHPLLLAIQSDGFHEEVRASGHGNVTDIEKMLRNETVMTKVCSHMKELVFPCLNGLSEAFLSAIHDKSYCKPFQNVPENFDVTKYTDALKLVDNLFCASGASSELEPVAEPASDEGKSCSDAVLASLLDDYAHHRSFSKYLGCGVADKTFGCCGPYVVKLLETVKIFNSVFDYLGLKYKGIPVSDIISLAHLKLEWCKFPGKCKEPDFPKPGPPEPLPSPPLPPQVKPKKPAEPQQIHLAFAGMDAKTGEPTGMSVVWLTREPTTTVVEYGLKEDNLDKKAEGTSSTYDNIGNVSDGKHTAVVETTYNHVAILESLPSNTVIFYRCVNNVTTSATYSFTTPPSFQEEDDRADRRKTVVAVYGDMGIFESQGTKHHLEAVADKADFYYHLGDIGYADDCFLHDLFSFGYQKTWDLYLSWMESVAARKPYMVLPGNHEAEEHSPFFGLKMKKLQKTFGNFSTYNNRFRMPSAESGGSANMWYSFNHGLAHYVSINTESDFPGHPFDNHTGLPQGGFGDQMTWLENDLKKAQAEREKRPWVIVSGHRPIYSIARAYSREGKPIGSAAGLQKAIEDLLIKYNVDLYLSGHVHSYERQSPICHNEPELSAITSTPTEVGPSGSSSLYKDSKCPVYIVQGAAGTSEFHNLHPAPKDRPKWSIAADDSHFGYGLLTIYNETTMEWKFYASDEDDMLLDQLVVDKQRQSKKALPTKQDYMEINTMEASSVSDPSLASYLSSSWLAPMWSLLDSQEEQQAAVAVM